MTDDWTDPLGAEYSEPTAEQERAAGRQALAITFAVAWLAVMAALGGVLFYAHRADQRAERSGRSVCELVHIVRHQADTQDAGVTVLLAPGEEREEAIKALRKTLDAAQREAERGGKDECRAR